MFKNTKPNSSRLTRVNAILRSLAAKVGYNGSVIESLIGSGIEAKPRSRHTKGIDFTPGVSRTSTAARKEYAHELDWQSAISNTKTTLRRKPVGLAVVLISTLSLVCGNAVIAKENAYEDKQAEEKEEEDKLNVQVSLNMDAFFGLNPFVGVTYKASEDYDLTFYGIQWGAGTGRDWANWTEAGIGVGFKALDGALYVNPQIGFTHGNLLSSAAQQQGVVGDGIVPNLTVNLIDPMWEGQFYAGWYRDLRDTGGNTTAEFLHYWLNGGRKFGRYFSGGIHFEELRRTGGSNIDGQVGYTWIGPYLQVAKSNAGMRLSAGADVADNDKAFHDSEFYKLQIFYNF